MVGDAARLQQIQANLLSNASKYSPRGAHVRFELRRDDGQAMIRVSDNGRGIEPDMLPRIFDLFVQGPQPLARSDGGLGIGLTLLRSLVELHDGRVEAHSDGADKGSVFTVWLPLAASARANVDAEQAPTTFTGEDDRRRRGSGRLAADDADAAREQGLHGVDRRATARRAPSSSSACVPISRWSISACRC